MNKAVKQDLAGPVKRNSGLMRMMVMIIMELQSWKLSHYIRSKCDVEYPGCRWIH